MGLRGKDLNQSNVSALSSTITNEALPILMNMDYGFPVKRSSASPISYRDLIDLLCKKVPTRSTLFHHPS